MPTIRPRRPHREPRTNKKDIAIVATAGVVAAGLIALAIGYFASVRTLDDCEVTAKDRSVSVSSDSNGNVKSTTDQRVYTSCGVFTVTDNPLLLRFNSADTYGALVEGQTLDLEVIGWRVGLLSWFPNVLSVYKTPAP
jgi:hypothetical protein